MKYAVDEIIDNIVKIENIETGEIKEISKDLFPESIQEGNIVVEGETYTLDLSEEELRKKRIEEKFNRLKNN